MRITNSQVEKFIGQYGARAERKETYMGVDILLADGGPHYDPENDVAFKDAPKEEQDEFSKGYYTSIAFIMGHKTIGVRTAYFKKDHDPDMTPEAKKEGRLTNVLLCAKEEIATGIVNNIYG